MSCMRGCFVLPSTPGKRVAVRSAGRGSCAGSRRRVMRREPEEAEAHRREPAEEAEAHNRDAAEEAEARRRDAVEAPRDRVRAGAVCHAASGAAAAPRRGEVRADDAPAGPREQASEAGRHTRRSTVPTARCQDTTAVFGSSWQVILEVWHDKYTKFSCKIHAHGNPAPARADGSPHGPPAAQMRRKGL